MARKKSTGAVTPKKRSVRVGSALTTEIYGAGSDWRGFVVLEPAVRPKKIKLAKIRAAVRKVKRAYSSTPSRD